MQTTDTTLPQVIDDCHELLKWLIPLLDQFPRTRRFTLGERLESGLLAVLEECVDAAYSKHKRPQLSAANRRLAQSTCCPERPFSWKRPARQTGVHELASGSDREARANSAAGRDVLRRVVDAKVSAMGLKAETARYCTLTSQWFHWLQSV